MAFPSRRTCALSRRLSLSGTPPRTHRGPDGQTGASVGENATDDNFPRPGDEWIAGKKTTKIIRFRTVNPQAGHENRVPKWKEKERNDITRIPAL